MRLQALVVLFTIALAWLLPTEARLQALTAKAATATTRGQPPVPATATGDGD